MRPRLPAILLAPGGLGLRLASSGYRRFFGLRSFLAVSSVASGRIEFVSQCFRHHSSTDYPFTSSCSPPRVATTQLLSVTRREAPPVRDFHPLCTFTLKRTRARSPSGPRSGYQVLSLLPLAEGRLSQPSRASLWFFTAVSALCSFGQSQCRQTKPIGAISRIAL
jgi:hypothetical protein